MEYYTLRSRPFRQILFTERDFSKPRKDNGAETKRILKQEGSCHYLSLGAGVGGVG